MEQKKKELAEMESIDYGARGRGITSPKIEEFWEWVEVFVSLLLVAALVLLTRTWRWVRGGRYLPDRAGGS